MIPKPYLIGGAVVGFALWTLGVWWFADRHGYNRCAVKTQEATIEAIEKARAEEQEKQEAVNATLRTQADEKDRINEQLVRDISRLRKRASRRHLSGNTQADCKGASGSELSAPDAEFLARESARADRLRTALKACYEYADTVGTKDD